MRSDCINIRCKLLLLVLITAAWSALAVPHRSLDPTIARRDDKDDAAGLGVELEVQQIHFKPANMQYTKDMWEKVKDADIWPVPPPEGFPKPQESIWRLTAESPRTEGSPFVEFIVDGRRNKLATTNMGKIGREIVDFLGKWNPSGSNSGLTKSSGASPQLLEMDGEPPLPGKWEVISPLAKIPKENFLFAPQITAPFPLDSLYYLMKDMRGFVKDNSLVNEVNSNMNFYKVVTKANFSNFDIDDEDITDEFLGSFSLLATWCQRAKVSSREEAPKFSQAIMPRTSFKEIYNSCIRDKLKNTYGCGKSLFDIVPEISTEQPRNLKKNDPEEDTVLKDKVFTWPQGQGTTQVEWNTKDNDLRTGTLKVETFLDYLQGKNGVPQADLVCAMDEALGEKQIGQLKDRKERALSYLGYNTNSKCAPIFEIRDLYKINGAALPAQMDKFAENTRRYHQLSAVAARGDPVAPLKRSLATTKRAKECKNRKKIKCPPGQVTAMIKNAPVCQEKCPAGQKKNAKGDECELDCPSGKQANAAGDKCEITCPKGENPNSNGDKCQKESENKTGCKDGEAKTNPRATCHKCPDNQKPGPDGTKCIPETNNDKNKDGKYADKPKTDGPKDEADRKKRIQRAGFCMAFAGVALGGIEGLDFASEAGAALINAEAAEFVENEWPSSIPFKEMDLSNSNIEPEFDKSAKSANARRMKRSSGFIEDQNNLVLRDAQEDSDDVKSFPSAQWTPVFRAELSSSEASHLQVRDPAAPAIAGGLVGGVVAGVTRLIIGAVSKVALRSSGTWSNKIANNAAQTGKAYQSTKPGAVAPAKTVEQAGKTAVNPAAKPPKFADKVKNIKNDKSFKDCLAIAAVASVGSMAFHAGDMIPKGGFKPEPRALVVTVFENEDNKGGKESTIQTFNDDFYHYDRLVPDKCADFSGTMDNKISGYEVLGGCCRFYKDKGCKGSLFAATNRGDKDLGKDVNDVMSSYACTFDTTCQGLPP